MANDEIKDRELSGSEKFVTSKFNINEDLYKDYEGAIKTSNELINAGPAKFLRGANARAGKKSIVGMAAKNTFEFPVFISKSVPLDYATATNSLLEQIYGSYLQMAISLNPLIDKRTAESGGPFSKYKTNITKYVEYTDMFYAHDAAYACYQNDEFVTEFSMISIEDRDAQFINESLDYQPMSEFDHFFQEADYKAPKKKKYEDTDLHHSQIKTDVDSGDVTMTSDEIASQHEIDMAEETYQNLRMQNDQLERLIQKIEKEKDALDRQKELDEATKEQRKQLLNNQVEQAAKQANNAFVDYQKKMMELGFELDDQGNPVKMNEDFWKSVDPSIVKDENGKPKIVNKLLTYAEEIKMKRQKLQRDAKKAGIDVDIAMSQLELTKKQERDYDKRMKMERERHEKDMMVRGPQFMDETKIQKLNTMKPLMMQVQMKVVDKQGGISAPVEYIVGVKTHSRLIEPDILPEVVEYPLKKMNQLSRKAKWRAGEIKFFDYLFKISEKKQTAIDARDPKRKWYRRLYELAHKKGDANVAARITGSNASGLIPNATIMLSQTDVDMVKEKTNINLLKGSTAEHLCNELFLMSIVVIDLDAESIKILLPDIDNDFEVHSLASVKKQLATLDTTGDKARDMFKLLGK